MGHRLQWTNQTTLGTKRHRGSPPPPFVFDVPSLSLKLNTACTDLKLDFLKSRLTWTQQLSEHMFWARPKICTFWQFISKTSSQVLGAKRLLFNVSFLFSPGKETDLIAMETYGQWHHIKLEKIRCTIGMGSLGNCYNTWQYILMTMWVWYLVKAVGQVGGFCLCFHVPTVCFNWKLLNQIKRPWSKNKRDNVNIPQYLHLIPKIRSCENTNSSRIKK